MCTLQVLGNHNIQTVNLKWLRSQISLVGQEPMLFNTTIFENIIYGLEGTATSLTTSELECLVEEAATQANAHDFITSLPLGYYTVVGEKGTQLSGGQRQRICIARAMIKNPQILLLDEATSALDVRAERSVQKALATAAKGRTTIVIAHKLSTIRDADNIVVMADGLIVEQGTHNELMAAQGRYAELVEKQQISSQASRSEATTDISGMEDGSDLFSEKESVNDRHLSDEKAEDTSVNQPQGALITPSSKPAASKKDTFTWSNLSAALKFIGKLSRPEMALISVATVAAIVAGLSVPAYVIKLVLAQRRM